MPKLTDYECIFKSNPKIKRYKSFVTAITTMGTLLWIFSIGVIIFQTQNSNFSSESNIVWGSSLILAIVFSGIARSMRRKLILKTEAVMIEKENEQPLREGK